MKRQENTTTEQIAIKSEQIPFTQITNQIIRNRKLSDGAKCLYCYLKSHNENFYLSKRQIAINLNKSERTIQYLFNELKKSGFLEIVKMEGKNQYQYILYNTPKNKEYLLLTELQNNGLNLSKYDFEQIYNILNNKQITQETKDLLNNKLEAIIRYNWLDD